MKNIKVWAHRGASGYAPENTLPAFAKAIEMQADGIELDVQMTKDGELVVIHDETLERVSGVKGWIKDVTYEELRNLNVNLRFPEYGQVTIPTLREVYEIILPTQMVINVELKNGVIFYPELEEKVFALTKEMGMWDRVLFSSFNHYSVVKMKEMDPTAKVGFLYADGIIDMPKYAVKYHVEALHPALYNLQFPGMVQECKEMGIQIHSWTVNEVEHMHMLCQFQVDAIITNYPDVALRIVKDYDGNHDKI